MIGSSPCIISPDDDSLLLVSDSDLTLGENTVETVGLSDVPIDIPAATGLVVVTTSKEREEVSPEGTACLVSEPFVEVEYADRVRGVG